MHVEPQGGGCFSTFTSVAGGEGGGGGCGGCDCCFCSSKIFLVEWKALYMEVNAVLAQGVKILHKK